MAPEPLHRKSSAPTVALESHALGTLKYIRASIDAAGMLAVPGSAGIAMGALGLAACALAALPALAARWLEVWLLAGIAAFACGSALLLHQALRRGAPLYRGPARRFALCLSPPLLAGAVLTPLLVRHGALALVPGTWLLLYGCGVTAASTMTVRPVTVMGACFIGLGVATLLAPPELANLALGAGFGGLHLAFGILIGRMGHEH